MSGTDQAGGTGRPGASERPAATVLRAITVTTVGVLPAFLTGGLAVQVRAELGFRLAALGLAVSLFFTASAIGSAALGRLVQAAGPRRSMRVAALMSAGCLLGIALLAQSWAALVAFLLLGGLANAISNPAANLLLAGAISPRRQGLAFGIKQAAIPTATLLSGLAAPLVALTAGWRAAYVGAALIAVAVAVVAPVDAAPAAPEEELPGSAQATLPALLALALGLGLGSAAAVPLGSFLVESGVAIGLAAGSAGALLALGSAASIAVRLLAGWRADQRQGGHLRVVAMLLALGTGGFWLLSLADSAWLLVPGALLGFAAGWGWPGLFNLAVVIENRERPASATGFTQTGAYLGSAGGPVLFGLVVEQFSYATAWRVSALLALGGAAAMLVARQIVRRARAAACQRTGQRCAGREQQRGPRQQASPQ